MAGFSNEYATVIYDNLLRSNLTGGVGDPFPATIELRVGKNASDTMASWVETTFTGYAAISIDLSGPAAGDFDFAAPTNGSGSTQVDYVFGTNGGSSTVASTEFNNFALRDTVEGRWIGSGAIGGLSDLKVGDTLRILSGQFTFNANAN